MTLPICCITGRIAGDYMACGDCDPCSAGHAVPDVVKRLMAERDEFAQKYEDAMGRVGELEWDLIDARLRPEYGPALYDEMIPF